MEGAPREAPSPPAPGITARIAAALDGPREGLAPRPPVASKAVATPTKSAAEARKEACPAGRVKAAVVVGPHKLVPITGRPAAVGQDGVDGRPGPDGRGGVARPLQAKTVQVRPKPSLGVKVIGLVGEINRVTLTRIKALGTTRTPRARGRDPDGPKADLAPRKARGSAEPTLAYPRKAGAPTRRPLTRRAPSFEPDPARPRRAKARARSSPTLSSR